MKFLRCIKTDSHEAMHIKGMSTDRRFYMYHDGRYRFQRVDADHISYISVEPYAFMVEVVGSDEKLHDGFLYEVHILPQYRDPNVVFWFWSQEDVNKPRPGTKIVSAIVEVKEGNKMPAFEVQVT